MLVAAALYALAAGVLVTIHWKLWLTGLDTGVYTQIILGTWHGFHSAFENASHLATHFSPLLGAFYPLLALTHSGLALQYAQIILIASAPIVLFAFVRPRVDAGLAQRIGIIAVLYPPIAAAGIGEFHILATLPLLAYGLVWAADRGRWGWFAAVAFMLLLVREDVLVELVALGAIAGFVLLRTQHADWPLLADPAQRRRLGFASISVAFAAAALAGAYFGLIQPAFGRAGWYPALYYHYGLPRGEAALFSPPLVDAPPNPAASLSTTLLRRAGYLLEALVPLALLPLRTWWWLLALPGLGLVLAATSASIWTMGAHYALLWAPWLVLAMAVALVQLHARRGERVARWWANAAIFCCVVFLVAINPMHLGYYLRPGYYDIADARRALACVPNGATVATHDQWFTHIAGTNLSANGDVIDGADYLVYADDFPDAAFQRQVKPELDRALATGRFRVVCSFASVRTYERIGK